jgi:hypothetical protein
MFSREVASKNSKRPMATNLKKTAGTICARVSRFEKTEIRCRICAMEKKERTSASGPRTEQALDQIRFRLARRVRQPEATPQVSASAPYIRTVQISTEKLD